MILKSWDALPENMRTEEVRPYYDLLKKHTFALILKRCFDVIMSLLLLIILSPVFLVLAVWIKIDSPGPVFFRQVRVTQYGREFKIFKFRTMVNDAEKKGTLVTVSADARITEVGKKIRHVRLDEIPQLINILTGDMTFVGTRPEVPLYVHAYTKEMMATLLLPAGVTSEASIQYKDEDDLISSAKNPGETYIKVVLPQKMIYNLNAIRSFSLGKEFKTLGRTLKAVA
jgi:lipopolysaccharide/colanic/teichoic acid biosynthesis glycosyltransferase